MLALISPKINKIMIVKRLLLLWLVSNIFISCGSYNDSINFSVNESRNIVIRKLLEMKTQNPAFKVFRTGKSTKELKDGIKDDNIYFYNNYFKIENITILFVINVSSDIAEKPTSVRLISVSFDNDNRNWIRFNSDKIDKKQQEKIITLFEENILSKLNANWERL
ncbi:hypothetical protein [Halpernia sp. GG3]